MNLNPMKFATGHKDLKGELNKSTFAKIVVTRLFSWRPSSHREISVEFVASSYP
jgi:hypothetical protein